jgi:hypothetical protein
MIPQFIGAPRGGDTVTLGPSERPMRVQSNKHMVGPSTVSLCAVP